jgi:hypothetical protein
MSDRPKNANAGAPFQPLWEDPSPRQEPQPWPPPKPWNDSGQWNNPSGTNPFPTPTNVPVGVWSGASQVVTVPVGATTTWRSPVFDLRPEFRASDGRRPTPSVPIWKPSTITGGAGGKLWVQLQNTDTENIFGLQVLAQEFAHISDVQQMISVDGQEDISTEFIPTAQSTVLTFVPPGAGYPVRFYQLELVFTVLTGTGPGCTFPVYSAYY